MFLEKENLLDVWLLVNILMIFNMNLFIIIIVIFKIYNWYEYVSNMVNWYCFCI